MTKIDPAKIRLHILDMVYKKQSGHIGGSFSIAEIVAFLYSNYEFAPVGDNRLILSKGHAVPAIYAALIEMGVWNRDDAMNNFREYDSKLQGHCDATRSHLIHASTGSLGQGLSIAVGHALALRMAKKDEAKVFCIMGDGELNEGQPWEAMMAAAKYQLDNLVVYVDVNGGQNDGWTNVIMPMDSLHDKITAFGWRVVGCNGHSVGDLLQATHSMTFVSPLCVLCHTTKANGVSFMEGGWHSKSPNDEQYTKAREELESQVAS